ncbi:MAG: glycoside hydrolase family 68 protein [Sphingorhabdus sp.]
MDKLLNTVLPIFYETRWSHDHVMRIPDVDIPSIPLITDKDVKDIMPGLQLWDCWTIDAPDGSAVLFDGWRGWIIMCAPRSLHPDLRHDVARLRLAMERDGQWKDCGYLLPEDINPGSREWAGSTVFEVETGKLIVFFTATGRRGEAYKTIEQRLFQLSGKMVFDGERLNISNWSDPIENVIADGMHYVVVDRHEGVSGFIKGFRDPFHFRDPQSGHDYLFFTGSAKFAASAYNGVIGLARSTNGSFSDWNLLAPLISAEGVNNELERPIVRYSDGRYYVFWSTQRKMFSPDSPSGPNGLYGMVSDSLFGPYRPLNGSGLVAANPAQEPYQAYSWWVDADLKVTGFVDLWGLKGLDPSIDPSLVEKHFGGVPAPRFQLVLDEDRARIAGIGTTKITN